MMRPNEKKLSTLLPELMSRFLIIMIEAGYKDKTFDEPRPCPRCRSEERHRLGRERRLFCIAIKEEGFERMYVYLKLFRCKRCGHKYTSRGPFYPKVMYGAPIVDMVLYLAASNPFNRVESIMMSWGVQVDRDTVKRWARLFKKRAEHMAGLAVFGTPLAINIFKLLFKAQDLEAIKERFDVKVANVVGDETYPAVRGCVKRLREENERRRLEGRSPRGHGLGWTVACCYSPELKCFSSLLVSACAFNRLLARVLMLPSKGADMRCFDGSTKYEGMEHEHCLNHLARNLRKRDPGWRRLRDAEPDERYRYAHERFQELKAAALERLLDERPDLFDGLGNFLGVLTTNSMEGGNWRIKYELRASYENVESIYSRVLLGTIWDSMYTFRCGRPQESFGSSHSDFSFSQVMGCEMLEATSMEERADPDMFCLAGEPMEEWSATH